MADTALPDGWVEKFNKEKGKAFFYNKITKKTQWQRPENNEAAMATASSETKASSAAATATAEAAQPSEVAKWTEHFSEKYKRKYWKHATTGEVAWKQPADFAPQVAQGSPAVAEAKQHTPVATAAVTVAAPAIAEDAISSSDWIEHYSEKYKRKYWKHKSTGETSWKEPPAPVSAPSAPLVTTTIPFANEKASVSVAPVVVSEWEELFNEKHQRKYWKHKTTGEKSWKPPPSQQQQPPSVGVTGSLQKDETSVALAASVSSTVSEWEELYNEKHKRKYWKHKVTGEKSWKPPPKSSPAAVDSVIVPSEQLKTAAVVTVLAPSATTSAASVPELSVSAKVVKPVVVDETESQRLTNVSSPKSIAASAVPTFEAPFAQQKQSLLLPDASQDKQQQSSPTLLPMQSSKQRRNSSVLSSKSNGSSFTSASSLEVSQIAFLSVGLKVQQWSTCIVRIDGSDDEVKITCSKLPTIDNDNNSAISANRTLGDANSSSHDSNDVVTIKLRMLMEMAVNETSSVLKLVARADDIYAPKPPELKPAEHNERRQSSAALNLFKKMDEERSKGSNNSNNTNNSGANVNSKSGNAALDTKAEKVVVKHFAIRFLSSHIASLFHSYLLSKANNEVTLALQTRPIAIQQPFKISSKQQPSVPDTQTSIQSNAQVSSELQFSALLLQQCRCAREPLLAYLSGRFQELHEKVTDIHKHSSVGFPVFEAELKALKQLLLSAAVSVDSRNIQPNTTNQETSYDKKLAGLGLGAIPNCGVIMTKVTSVNLTQPNSPPRRISAAHYYRDQSQPSQPKEKETAVLMNWSSHWVKIDYAKQLLTFHDHGPGSPLTMTVSFAEAHTATAVQSQALEFIAVNVKLMTPNQSSQVTSTASLTGQYVRTASNSNSSNNYSNTSAKIVNLSLKFHSFGELAKWYAALSSLCQPYRINSTTIVDKQPQVLQNVPSTTTTTIVWTPALVNHIFTLFAHFADVRLSQSSVRSITLLGADVKTIRFLALHQDRLMVASHSDNNKSAITTSDQAGTGIAAGNTFSTSNDLDSIPEGSILANLNSISALLTPCHVMLKAIADLPRSLPVTLVYFRFPRANFKVQLCVKSTLKSCLIERAAIGAINSNVTRVDHSIFNVDDNSSSSISGHEYFHDATFGDGVLKLLNGDINLTTVVKQLEYDSVTEYNNASNSISESSFKHIRSQSVTATPNSSGVAGLKSGISNTDSHNTNTEKVLMVNVPLSKCTFRLVPISETNSNRSVGALQHALALEIVCPIERHTSYTSSYQNSDAHKRASSHSFQVRCEGFADFCLLLDAVLQATKLCGNHGSLLLGDSTVPSVNFHRLLEASERLRHGSDFYSHLSQSYGNDNNESNYNSPLSLTAVSVSRSGNTLLGWDDVDQANFNSSGTATPLLVPPTQSITEVSQQSTALYSDVLRFADELHTALSDLHLTQPLPTPTAVFEQLKELKKMNNANHVLLAELLVMQDRLKRKAYFESADGLDSHMATGSGQYIGDSNSLMTTSGNDFLNNGEPTPKTRRSSIASRRNSFLLSSTQGGAGATPTTGDVLPTMSRRMSFAQAVAEAVSQNNNSSNNNNNNNSVSRKPSMANANSTNASTNTSVESVGNASRKPSLVTTSSSSSSSTDANNRKSSLRMSLMLDMGTTNTNTATTTSVAETHRPSFGGIFDSIDSNSSDSHNDFNSNIGSDVNTGAMRIPSPTSFGRSNSVSFSSLSLQLPNNNNFGYNNGTKEPSASVLFPLTDNERSWCIQLIKHLRASPNAVVALSQHLDPTNRETFASILVNRMFCVYSSDQSAFGDLMRVLALQDSASHNKFTSSHYFSVHSHSNFQRTIKEMSNSNNNNNSNNKGSLLRDVLSQLYVRNDTVSYVAHVCDALIARDASFLFSLPSPASKVSSTNTTSVSDLCAKVIEPLCRKIESSLLDSNNSINSNSNSDNNSNTVMPMPPALRMALHVLATHSECSVTVGDALWSLVSKRVCKYIEVYRLHYDHSLKLAIATAQKNNNNSTSTTTSNALTTIADNVSQNVPFFGSNNSSVDNNNHIRSQSVSTATAASMLFDEVASSAASSNHSHINSNNNSNNNAVSSPLKKYRQAALKVTALSKVKSDGPSDIVYNHAKDLVDFEYYDCRINALQAVLRLFKLSLQLTDGTTDNANENSDSTNSSDGNNNYTQSSPFSQSQFPRQLCLADAAALARSKWLIARCVDLLHTAPLSPQSSSSSQHQWSPVATIASHRPGSSRPEAVDGGVFLFMQDELQFLLKHCCVDVAGYEALVDGSSALSTVSSLGATKTGPQVSFDLPSMPSSQVVPQSGILHALHSLRTSDLWARKLPASLASNKRYCQVVLVSAEPGLQIIDGVIDNDSLLEDNADDLPGGSHLLNLLWLVNSCKATLKTVHERAAVITTAGSNPDAAGGGSMGTGGDPHLLGSLAKGLKDLHRSLVSKGELIRRCLFDMHRLAINVEMMNNYQAQLQLLLENTKSTLQAHAYAQSRPQSESVAITVPGGNPMGYWSSEEYLSFASQLFPDDLFHAAVERGSEIDREASVSKGLFRTFAKVVRKQVELEIESKRIYGYAPQQGPITASFSVDEGSPRWKQQNSNNNNDNNNKNNASDYASQVPQSPMRQVNPLWLVMQNVFNKPQ